MDAQVAMFETPWSEFTGQGEDYDHYRPHYPAEVATVILQHIRIAGLSGLAADVGSGTGLFTRVLATELRGVARVVGVEPNADMARVARDSTPAELGVTYKVASAEALPFPPLSLCAATAATAAHRFDRSAFFDEVSRTMKAGGMLALVHNRHRYWDSAAIADYHAFVESCTPEYQRGMCTTAHGTYAHVDFAAELSTDRRFADVHVKRWEWDFTTDLTGFLSLSLTSSIIQRSAAVIGRQAVVDKLSALFDRYSKNGLLDQAHVTEVTYATKRA